MVEVEQVKCEQQGCACVVGPVIFNGTRLVLHAVSRRHHGREHTTPVDLVALVVRHARNYPELRAELLSALGVLVR